jgi:ABC-type antimicrobial peptide transport system permease subunit
MNNRLTRSRLVWRSLLGHWRANVPVALGVALASAALCGALTVGHSVRLSLRQIAEQRIGRVDYGVLSADRLFRAELADDISAHIDATVAPLLMLNGAAVNPGNGLRANDVQLLGIDDRFASLAPTARTSLDHEADSSGVMINEALAGHLQLDKGDSILLRVAPLDAMPHDAPLGQPARHSQALRFTVERIVGAEDFGHFSLRAEQIPPRNVFIPLAVLSKALAQPGRVNLLLIDADEAEVSRQHVQQALRSGWTLDDAQLELQAVMDRQWLELHSDRVFIEPAVAEAARTAAGGAQGVLTYLTNALRHGERSTPYSFVAALSDVLLPVELTDDQIAINHWLADDLQTDVGDTLMMRYYVLADSDQLIEQETSFTIAAVLPMQGIAADRSLMPKLPGIEDAANNRDWQAGFDVDLSRIREVDEQYWDEYRGTPKAFLTLATGQKLWSNRYGQLTALRWNASEHEIGALRQTLRQAIDPADVGLTLQDIRGRAEQAWSNSQDFGGLFIGFSFFVIVAALVLTGLLFGFALEQRAGQIGLMLATGMSRRTIIVLHVTEGLIIAAVGTMIGSMAGLGYAAGALGAMRTIWQQAVPGAAVKLHAGLQPLLIGGAITTITAIAVMLWISRSLTRFEPRELLSGTWKSAGRRATTHRRPWLIVSIIGFTGTVLMTWWSIDAAGSAQAGGFFGAGALLLVSLLSAAGQWLTRRRFSSSIAHMSIRQLGQRNTMRRRSRSLATMAMLAFGCFSIVAVGASRYRLHGDPTDHASGTGGFTLMARSAIPLQDPLLEPLSTADRRDLDIAGLRIHGGDDASCLNLNRPAQPPIWGVDAEVLAQRRSFRFVSQVDGASADNPWRLLTKAGGDESIVPAIADAETVTWALGLTVGDTLTVTDSRGRPLKLRIVATLSESILQGALLIDEQPFRRRFIGEGGNRAWLIDAPTGQVESMRQELSYHWADIGLEVLSTRARLAQFQQVKNTYLSIFAIIGGIGVMLGSGGLAVVLLRHLFERQAELALLRAVGWSRRRIVHLVLAEHWLLLWIGIGSGVVAGGLAVWPTLAREAGAIPWVTLAVVVAGVMVAGFSTTALAAWLALRRPLLAALRSE